MQDVKQCDGVGTAGDTDDDRCARRDQPFALNRRFDFFNQVHGQKLPRTDENEQFQSLEVLDRITGSTGWGLESCSSCYPVQNSPLSREGPQG